MPSDTPFAFQDISSRLPTIGECDSLFMNACAT